MLMKIISLCFLSLCLAGCATKRPATIAIRPLPATALTDEAVSDVRYPEILRAYHFGRSIDSAHGQTMHEGHAAYRVEQTTRWNLHPRPPGNSPAMASRPLEDAAHAPAPLNEESVAELNRQKEITQTVASEASRLSATLQQLATTLAETKHIAKENAALKEQISATEKRLIELESEWRRFQAVPAPAPAAPPTDWRPEP